MFLVLLYFLAGTMINQCQRNNYNLKIGSGKEIEYKSKLNQLELRAFELVKNKYMNIKLFINSEQPSLIKECAIAVFKIKMLDEKELKNNMDNIKNNNVLIKKLMCTNIQ